MTPHWLRTQGLRNDEKDAKTPEMAKLEDWIGLDKSKLADALNQIRAKSDAMRGYTHH